MDLHDLVVKLKELTQELGRKPTKEQFMERMGITRHILDARFGGWHKILAAADMQPDPRNKKLTNEYLFGASVSDVLDSYEPVNFCSKKTKSKILVIGDTHFPFHNQKCLNAIYKFNKDLKPDYIVQVGDLLDLYAHSKFPRSQNIDKPEEEEREGRKAAEKMWETLLKDNPSAKCFQLFGNHDLRPAKRVLESLPTMEHVVRRYYKELMTFPGVTTIEDYRQELIIDGIVFHHGYRSQLGSHRDYVLRNFVCGHSHKGGVVYKRLRDEIIWELNAGFAGDADSKVLAYTAQKIHDQTLGWGFIDEYGPRFISL